MKPRPLFRSACAILGVAVAVWVTLLVLDSNRRTARLPDGSVLEIARVVYARTFNYRHERGNPLERGLNRMLPLSWRLRLGLKSRSGGGFSFGDDGATNLMLVTCQQVGSANNPIALERIRVVDDDGSSFEAVSDAITFRPAGEVIQGWRFKAFPRRGKVVRCRFMYKDSSGNYVSAAEMKIANPAPGRPYAQWRPEQLPATSKDGDLSVTLLDFIAGLRHEQDVEPKNRWYWIGRQTTRAVFQAQQAGSARPPWKLHSLSIADATGNYWKASLEDPPDPPAGANLVAEFIGALWPSETAWKLRVELCRTNGFAPDELLSLPDIAVPASNQVATLNITHETNGTMLKVVAIGGVGAEMPEPYRSIASAGKVNLALQFESSDHQLTLFKVVDDRGRLVSFREPNPWFENKHSFELELSAGANALVATFAIHKSRFVEFIAKPRLVGN